MTEETLLQQNLETLQEKINYTFSDNTYLLRAITHRSAKQKPGGRNYERMEFLGDAVLDLAVARMLIEHYPDHNEGDLSKMRAALVNTVSLATIARELDLGPLILLSPGEQSSGGAEKNSILADVVEAVFGAIYMDGGFESAFTIAKDLFAEPIKTVKPKDPKTELQEMLHILDLEAPEYVLDNTDGPDHAPTFVSLVKVGEEVIGRGVGNSKKESQQEAANEALKRLKEQSN